MSEQESGGSGNAMIVVDKTASSRNKPYRPNELQEETVPDLHKRSKAPTVPSLAEELKDITLTETLDRLDHKDNIDRAMSSEKHTHVSNKLSTNKKRGSSPEEIAMALVETKKDISGTLQQPIPAKVEAVASEASSVTSGKAGNKADDDSITEEVAELRTADPAKEHSEWSDDEEAGGLPRSESRASRVSRAMRQLFCCGVAYHAPSEEDIPPREFSGI